MVTERHSMKLNCVAQDASGKEDNKADGELEQQKQEEETEEKEHRKDKEETEKLEKVQREVEEKKDEVQRGDKLHDWFSKWSGISMCIFTRHICNAIMVWQWPWLAEFLSRFCFRFSKKYCWHQCVWCCSSLVSGGSMAGPDEVSWAFCKIADRSCCLRHAKGSRKGDPAICNMH